MNNATLFIDMTGKTDFDQPGHMFGLPVERRKAIDQGIRIGRLGRIDENNSRTGHFRLSSWCLLSAWEPAGHDGIAFGRVTATENGRATSCTLNSERDGRFDGGHRLPATETSATH